MNIHPFASVHRLMLGTTCMATLILSACSATPTAVDSHFGQAVQQAQARQSLNDPATHPCQHSAHMRDHDMNRPRPQQACSQDTDGVSAKSAVDRYQKSFENPPPPVQVFNIDFGSASPR